MRCSLPSTTIDARTKTTPHHKNHPTLTISLIDFLFLTGEEPLRVAQFTDKPLTSHDFH